MTNTSDPSTGKIQEDPVDYKLKGMHDNHQLPLWKYILQITVQQSYVYSYMYDKSRFKK